MEFAQWTELKKGKGRCGRMNIRGEWDGIVKKIK